MEVLQKYAFTINENTNPLLKYPQLVSNSYSFSFTVESVFYTAIIYYNQVDEGAFISIYDNNNNIVSSSLRVVGAITPLIPNLFVKKEYTSQFSLVYSYEEQAFLLYGAKDALV